VGASVCSVMSCHADERTDATVKSCGPGLPVLRSSFAADDPRGDGGKSRSPGRARISRSNHRAGKAGYSWLSLWFCRVLICCTRAMGTGRCPAFPVPSLLEMGAERIYNSGAMRREIARFCHPLCDPRVSSVADRKPRGQASVQHNRAGYEDIIRVQRRNIAPTMVVHRLPSALHVC
jgi:hypothetical protein